MKRLIASTILVTVTFLAIGGIINSVKAGFDRDEKALELIRAAKTAIGGADNLAGVRSMTIKGTTTNYFERDGIQDVKQGGLEINFELPGQYSKRVKIGNPADTEFIENVDKDIVVKVDKVEGELPAELKDGKGGVFVFKKKDGENIEFTTDTNGKVKVDGNRVIIKKDDGTVEEIDLGDAKKHKIIVREGNGGETIDVIGSDEGEGTWTTKDGRKMKVISEVHAGRTHRHSNELLRMTFALIMNAPMDGSVNYRFAGESNVDGYPTNIVKVEPQYGSAFKVHLDASTNLPRAVVYKSNDFVFFQKKDGEMTREQLIEMKTRAAKTAYKMMKFDDFRTVGSLSLPHRWTEVSGDKILRTVDVTSIDINPEGISNKFGGKNVFLRKMKEKN